MGGFGPPSFAGWQLWARYIHTPQGVFVELPSPRTMIGLCLLYLVVLVGALCLGRPNWSALIPGVLVLGLVVEPSIRFRHLPGAPLAMLEGETLRLFMPNYLGRKICVDLKDVQALSFYGPLLSEFAVIRSDGKQERHHPVWNKRSRIQVQRFLKERLSGRIEVREGEQPSLFDDIRGRYEP